jgi:hypothetical protein
VRGTYNTFVRLVLVLLTVSCVASLTAASTQPFDAKELATYRLTDPVFERFGHATHLVAKVIHAAPRFQQQPLLSRDILSDGDAAEMAALLQRRLDEDASLSAALFAADITSRDYATFAIVLFGARMAHGFVASGALRRVPAGVAADNVAFVARHEKEIAALLKQLDLE